MSDYKILVNYTYTGMMLARCYKLLSYVSTGRPFTVNDVMSQIECSKKTALRHIDGLSLCFPLAEVGDRRDGQRGPMTTVFQMIKDD